VKEQSSHIADEELWEAEDRGNMKQWGQETGVGDEEKEYEEKTEYKQDAEGDEEEW
jgi:hypothetical protein